VTVEKLVSGLQGAATLPWSWYSDPDVLRLEQERIFRCTWQYVGRTGQVAEPGTYLAGRAGDVPVMVVRARDGELRAFLNVCRHRGHVLVEGEGRRKTIQCPYHAWTYSLDGSLRAAPRADREPGFDPGELSLVRVQVATWGPFLFVNADPDAAPLTETLGELPELLAAGGIDIDTLRHHSRAESALEANWKISAENFLECYHCPVAHPGFSSVVDVNPDEYDLRTHPTFASQFAHPRAKLPAAPAYEPVGELEWGQFHLLYPNLAINVMPGRPNLSIGPILPAGPERTYRFLDYFFGPDVDDEWIQEMLAFDNQVGREDRSLVEGVQRGVRSGVLERGRLMVTSERLVAAFQRYVADALGPSEHETHVV
jgi:phenylpropionate dioxygenase-like ring-hydroxylating dioxygenase large terminal subunit